MPTPATARFVGPLERLIYLKSLPNFGDLSSTSLAAIAEHVQERFYREGDRLILSDRAVGAVYFIVEGQASVTFRGRHVTRVRPPNGVGFLGLMAGLSGGVEAVADVDTLALELSAEVLWDLLEDNFQLAYGGIRQLSRQLRALRQRLPSRLKDDLPKSSAPLPDRPLDLVERLLVMRQSTVFRGCNLDALAEISRRMCEVRAEPEAVLWERGEPARFGVTIVRGIVRCEEEAGHEWRAGDGFGLGYLDAMSDLPRAYRAVAETPLLGLRGENEVFVDVLEESPGMVKDMLGFLSRSLLELYTTEAEQDPEGKPAAVASA